MNLKLSPLLTALGAALLGWLGAWLLMNIHLPAELLKVYEPGFLSSLAGEGAAPDQYRVLQRLFIGLIYQAAGFYYALFWFTAASLAAAIFFFIEHTYPGIPRSTKQTLAIALTLLYPVLMYNGPCGDTAFILLLALGTAAAIEREDKPLFLIMLGLMAFTRADIALFSALFALLWKPGWFSPLWTALVVTLPIVVQATLQFVIFPEARYYPDLRGKPRPSDWVA